MPYGFPGGGGGSLNVPDDRRFATTSARDAAIPSPVEGEQCTIESSIPQYHLLQEYRSGSWVDITYIIKGPKGDKGEGAADGMPDKGSFGIGSGSMENLDHGKYYVDDYGDTQGMPAGLSNKIGLMTVRTDFDNVNGKVVMFFQENGKLFQRIKLAGGWSDWFVHEGKSVEPTPGPPPTTGTIYFGFDSSSNPTDSNVAAADNLDTTHAINAELHYTRNESSEKYLFAFIPDALIVGSSIKFETGIFPETWNESTMTVSGVAGKLYVSTNPTHTQSVTYKIVEA